ncbi:hypothetical protein MBLNU459_g1638t1 [Dothideomycetes sp. NU459]
MLNLTQLIRTELATEEETPEDFFASAPGFLFTDDLINSHGDSNATMYYKSRRFGEIELKTADPSQEEERRLFSHYLWNAGVLMSERVSGERLLSDAERTQWSVDGETVLELGAGVGLSGIVSTLAGAKQVVVSDYPAPVVLANIRRNVERNVPQHLMPRVQVEGHEWGVFDDACSSKYAHHFSRVIAADCYWMPYQHQNLARSMLHFLSDSPDACVLAIGGFHTGRAKLAMFFDVAVEEGLRVDDIYEEDATGIRREWVKEKDGGRENVTERKKWLAIAILRRASK